MPEAKKGKGENWEITKCLTQQYHLFIQQQVLAAGPGCRVFSCFYQAMEIQLSLYMCTIPWEISKRFCLVPALQELVITLWSLTEGLFFQFLMHLSVDKCWLSI
jgi:hypothetical protein